MSSNIFVALCLACTGVTESNLATNPSFERWQGDVPAGWVFNDDSAIETNPRLRGERGRDEKEKHAGNASVVISALRAGTTLTTVDSFPVKPGEIYLVAVWTKVKGSFHYGFLKPYVAWFDADGRPVPATPKVSQLKRYADWDRAHDWERQSAVGRAPAGTATARPAIFICKTLMETVWLDDVEFRRVGNRSAAHIHLKTYTPKPRRPLTQILANGSDQLLLVGRVSDANGDIVADGTQTSLTTSDGELAENALVTEDGFFETTFTAGKKGGAVNITAKADSVVAVAKIDQLQTGRFHGRVVDKQTGKPVAARLRVKLSGGGSFKGSGFWVDGTFDEQVPVGKVSVTAGKGPEYVPVTVDAEVLAQRDRPPLELPLERKVNMGARGWYCGDMHAHVIHGERYVPATMKHGAVGARAEGLDCYFATHTWDGVEAEADYRTRLATQLSTDSFKVDWNWEVKWFPGGHCWEIGTHWEKPEDEYPLGPYPHPGGVRAHFEAHHAIHQRGGIVGFTHPNVSHNPATELPFDLLAGPTFDAIDIMTTGASANNEKTWYLILDHGYRMPCTGTSDSCMDIVWAPHLGRCRTYAWLGDRPLSIANFAAAIKAGRTFATSGPMLDFTIDGQRPGAVLQTGPQAHAVKIWARSEADPKKKLRRIEWVRNGNIVRKLELAGHDAEESTAEFSLTETDNAWYIVRCVGDRGRLAVSSPIYFRKPDFQPPQPLKARVTFRITSAGGKPITATVQAFNYGKPFAAFTAEGGRLACQVPPTAWFEISAPDHKPVQYSIFFDVPEIFRASTHAGLSLDQRNRFLATWEPFDKMARLLRNIKLHAKLQPN